MDQSTLSSGQPVQPSMKMALKVWWAYTWRLMLVSIAMTVVLQIVMMMVMVPMLSQQLNSDQPQLSSSIFIMMGVTYVVITAGMILAQIYFFKVVLNKEFSDFKTALLKK
jgi:hypothetical protein